MYLSVLLPSDEVRAVLASDRLNLFATEEDVGGVGQFRVGGSGVV